MTATGSSPLSADVLASLRGLVEETDEFARYARLATRVTGAAFARVLLVPPPHPGLPGSDPLLAEGSVLHRLAAEAVERGSPLVVGDTAGHWLGQRSIVSGLRVRAVAALPLPSLSGIDHGALCVFDRRPRSWHDDEVEALAEIAALAGQEVELRREALERRTLENLVRMLSTAVENMQLGVTVTDLEGKIVYTNPAEARMHGFDRAELVGRHARILGPPESGRTVVAGRMRDASSWTRETVNVRKDGTRFPVLLWSDQVRDSSGECLGIITCCEDITERKQAEERLREIALRDPLTGLPNRTYFLDRLNQAIHHARRRPEERFAVLFLDLDRFKVVNDSLGHHVGDELLGVIGSRLLGCLRSSDLVARFGGDEFAVLLEEVRGSADAVEVAQRIQEELSSPIHLDGYELFTSASIGIVLSSPDGDEPEHLWRSADMAMYRAKAGGSGRFEVFDAAMHEEALARLQLETDLRRAVERGELRLHYQPVVALDSGTVIGFEALLRWLHPTRGMISPGEVIPAAEETGMIHAIGEWVLQEACRQIAAWRETFGPLAPVWVGVNLSSKQISQPGLVDQLEAAIRASRIAPGLLKVEITETAVMENTEAAAEVLRAVKALGVQLFMDDFGTGYSSLSYLHSLPLDAMKIDRSFIGRMERGNQHAQMVETILNLARGVKLRVVAEGICTLEQLALLREMGCDYGQGFLFSQPLSSGDAEALLHRPHVW